MSDEHGEPRAVRSTGEMMRRRNALVIEQLLGELVAERWDSKLTKRILAAPGSFPRLLRACYLARAELGDDARADVEHARAHGERNPVVMLAIGMILLALGDEAPASEALARAAELSPNARLDDGAQLDAAALLDRAERMLLRALAKYSGPRQVR